MMKIIASDRPKRTANVVSISGGKDSDATVLVAIEEGVENIIPVFADTGNEEQETYDHVAYLDGFLRDRIGVGVTTVRADFSDKIQRKRVFIQEHWPADLMKGTEGAWEWNGKVQGLGTFSEDEDGQMCEDTYVDPKPDSLPIDPYAEHKTAFWSWKPGRRPLTETEAAEHVRLALEVLHPTGNPFLDLCLWKGRFPSTKARFCSEQLKHIPIDSFIRGLMDDYSTIISWQGVRADESENRRNLPMRDVEYGSWEPEPSGWLIYRPIIKWTAQDVFDFHRKHGMKWNPLYEQGMGRVGCMPCIHARKNELRNIALRFPKEIERIRQWEMMVSQASKRGASSFFAHADGRGDNILEVVEWSKTSRGGKNYDLLNALEEEDIPLCSSQYGLCE